MMVCDMNQILESALKMGFSLEELNSVLLQKMKIEDLRDAIIRNARNHTAWQNEEKKKPTSEQQVCESAVYEDDVGLENFCFSFWCKKKLKTCIIPVSTFVAFMQCIGLHTDLNCLQLLLGTFFLYVSVSGAIAMCATNGINYFMCALLKWDLAALYRMGSDLFEESAWLLHGTKGRCKKNWTRSHQCSHR